MHLSFLQQRLLAHLSAHPAPDLYVWASYLRHSTVNRIAASLNEHSDDVWYAIKNLRMRGHIDSEGQVIQNPKPVAGGFFDVRDLLRGDAKPISLDTNAR